MDGCPHPGNTGCETSLRQICRARLMLLAAGLAGRTKVACLHQLADDGSAMGIRFLIDLPCQCVVTRMWGPVSGPDIHEYLRTMVAHSDFHADYPRMVDMRRITQMPTTAEMRMLAQTASALPGGTGRRALIADRDYPFGLLRMFEIIAGIHSTATDYRAFRDPASAAEWLGLDASVTTLLDEPDENDLAFA